MNHSQLTLPVRQRVHDSFRRLHADVETDWRESLLVQDGYYCGRRFECGGLKAIWFVEEDQIKVYTQDGSVAESHELNEQSNVNHSRVA